MKTALDEARTAISNSHPDPVGPPGIKKVPVHLFKDSGRYKDDVTVIVNGRSYQIQRGKTVMVPDFVAEVLDHQKKQDQDTADLITSYGEEFRAEADRLGV